MFDIILPSVIESLFIFGHGRISKQADFAPIRQRCMLDVHCFAMGSVPRRTIFQAKFVSTLRNGIAYLQ